jgi:Ca-activated chloride channel homolog
MGFERPLLLALLLLAPLHWWLRTRWLELEMKRLRTFVRPVLWDRVCIEPPPSRLLSRSLWTAGLASLALAMAGPTWGTTGALSSTGGKNLVIALDVSQSMGSLDEMPSRLGRAAVEIARLAGELDDVRMALVIFSGTPRLAVPITMDSGFLISRIPTDPWSASDIAPGTRLEDVVQTMLSALPQMDLEARLGIIFSDGGFHDYSVAGAVDAASSGGMRLISVGMGGPLEVTVPGRDGSILVNAGDTVRTALDPSAMRELAEGTGGAYLALSDTDDLPGLVRGYLDQLAESNSELAAGGSTSARRYQIFLGGAVMLFLCAVIMERRGV